MLILPPTPLQVCFLYLLVSTPQLSTLRNISSFLCSRWVISSTRITDLPCVLPSHQAFFVPDKLFLGLRDSLEPRRSLEGGKASPFLFLSCLVAHRGPITLRINLSGVKEDCCSTGKAGKMYLQLSVPSWARNRWLRPIFLFCLFSGKECFASSCCFSLGRNARFLYFVRERKG